jgi:hypothetical protein
VGKKHGTILNVISNFSRGVLGSSTVQNKCININRIPVCNTWNNVLAIANQSECA